MKILIASDSFKGSLSTAEVAAGIQKGACKVFPDAEIHIMPMADGGEGTVNVLVDYLGGTYEQNLVQKPNGGTRQASFGVLKNNVAVLEMAEASGITLVAPGERDIMKATTYGTGELIRAALDKGCRQIYLGIGGSATNDAGVGMAQALGASFKDSNGKEIGPGGGSLKDIASIDLSGMDKRLEKAQITVMCDVTNPLYGPEGAASIYGPQKGATPEKIEMLDEGMKHLADLMCSMGYDDTRWEQGAGAAGGLGFGLMTFTGARLRRGIEAILDICNFDEEAAWADIVVTGEGRIDSQSICGKVIDGITKRAREKNKPVIAIAGCLADDAVKAYDIGLESMEACVYRPMTVEEAMKNADLYLEKASERVFRSIRVGMELIRENPGFTF